MGSHRMADAIREAGFQVNMFELKYLLLMPKAEWLALLASCFWFHTCTIVCSKKK